MASSPLSPDPVRIEQTVSWLAGSLERAIESESLEWNRIASVTFPLARQVEQGGGGERQRLWALLDRVAMRVVAIDPATMSCGELADRYLTLRFLGEAGVVHTALADGEALDLSARCLDRGEAFDRTNLLLLACRYHLPLAEEGVRQTSAALAASQDRSGGFRDDSGRGGYYLTSHAMLALHACGVEQESVERAAAAIARHLPIFRARGNADELAESLIFLRWIGYPVDKAMDYRDFILGRVSRDGGLCFRFYPGCQPHWHATSLLLELWVERPFDH